MTSAHRDGQAPATDDLDRAVLAVSGATVWHHDWPARFHDLAGRLQQGVRVLEECWQSTLAGRRVMVPRLDLIGVTSIDDAGQACLAALHRQGAEFIAADPLTKDIVAEITQGLIPDHVRPKGESFE